MKIGIIHLSDIHFESQVNKNSLLTKKTNIIDSIKNKILDFDSLFIIVSGDIAFSGKKSEFDIAKEFLSQMVQELKNYSNKDIFLLGVPGNHDCDFEDKQKTRELILDGLINCNFTDLDEDIIKQCCFPQNEFFKFQNEIFFNGCKIIFQSELLNIIEYSIGDYKIIFNCFNTAWTSKLNEKEGRMAFPVNYFENRIFDNPCDLKINVIHHPINWQNKSSYRELRKFLNINGDITLSGHEHHMEINKMTDLTDNSCIYIESAALQESGNSAKSYFNLIYIDFEINTIKVDLFEYKKSYEKREILKITKLLDVKKRTNLSFPLNISFSNYLESTSAQFLHKRADKILIDDVFVSPYLRTTDSKNEKIKILNFNEIINKEKLGKITLVGAESSGKSTLCKKIFKHYFEKGFQPILISGSKIIKPTFDFLFNTLIKDAFIDQYHNSSIEKFDEIDKSNLIIIIDDFQSCELKTAHRKEFVKVINKTFENIIFTSNSILYFNPVTDADGAFDEFDLYNIIEFSYELRYDLIRKWNAIGENELLGNELHRKNELYDQQVKSFLGKNFLPHYPFVILAALQSLDQSSASEQGFSYYYKYLIEESLKKNIKRSDDLQFYNYFLSDFCYFLFQEKIKTLSKASFENFFKKYIQRKKVNIGFNDAFNQLLASKTLRYENEFVSISYNYIYYYYVATAIANSIDDPSVKALVEKLVERLYVDEYSGIIVFLSQISTNTFLTETLQRHTDEYYKEFSPANLSTDIESIDKLMKSIPELIIEDKNVEERRNEELEKRKNAELKEKAEEESYISSEYDLDEDISGISILNNFIRAIKTFEIFGQVIKKNWGAYDGIKKEEYVKSTFDLSMRVLSGYFSLIVQNEKDLIDYIYYIADKKELNSKHDIEKFAKELIFHLAYISSHGIIKRVSNSISHIQLKETFNELIDKYPSNSYKLIKLSITMDHFGFLPNDEIYNLLNKDKEFKKYYLPKLLLQNFVHQYLHMYEVPYDERNKICALVGIKINEQRSIQGGSKEMKK